MAGRDRRAATPRIEEPPELTAESAPPVQQSLEDDIATTAYAKFCERGGEHGHDVDDWLEAEREVRERRAAARPPLPDPAVADV